MKLLIATFLFCSLCAPHSIAQTSDELTEKEVTLTANQRIDTLVRFVRKTFYNNQFGATIEHGEKYLKLAKKADNHSAIFRLSSLIGNAFLQLDDTLQAKRIFFRTIKNAERSHDTTGHLTTARIDLGNLYALQEKNNLAIKLYKEAIPLAERQKDTIHLFILNYNIAELSLDLKKVKQSEQYVAKTNEFVKNVKADAYHSVANLVTGRLYMLKNENETALEYLNKSIELAENSGYIEALIEANEALTNTHLRLNNYKTASDLLLKRDSIKSEKYRTDKIQAAEVVTANFKLNQYKQDAAAAILQNEISLQKTKRETTYFWIKIVSAVLFILFVFLFFSYFKRKNLLNNLVKKNNLYLEAKELSEAQIQAKTRLFSNITHELRTPMYGIVGITSLLQDDPKLKHHKENINSLKFSAEYLLSLINNVLQYTQNITTNQKLNRTEFNLSSLVHNVVDSSKFLNTTNPNSYHVQIDKSIPSLLLGDEIKLSQVLMNLMSNSSKFTQNGFITLEVERLEETENKVKLQFYIQDNGIGISKKRQRTIFTEFSESCSNYEHQGTGLGLSIVKKLLDLFGSEINLESEEKIGTKISFVIDFEKCNEQENVKTPEVIKNDALRGKKILVVDDNGINLIVTKKTLEKYKAEVIVVNNGQIATELVYENAPDLILMDVNMPGMNGYEATEIIRMFNKDVPIIALTAVEEEHFSAEKSNVFTDLIIKPFKQEEFINLLSSYLLVEA